MLLALVVTLYYGTVGRSGWDAPQAPDSARNLGKTTGSEQDRRVPGGRQAKRKGAVRCRHPRISWALLAYPRLSAASSQAPGYVEELRSRSSDPRAVRGRSEGTGAPCMRPERLKGLLLRRRSSC